MITKNVKIGNSELTLYVLSNYEEINPLRRRPMVIICPGGGYHFCSERESEPVAIRFCSFGFNTAVLKYSLNPTMNSDITLYPTPQQELADTIAYIREHADELNTDPHMIVGLGFSAGGHLVASIGCMYNQFNIKGRLDAMVLCYAATSYVPEAYHPCFTNLCGRNEELKEQLSLEHRVNKNTPPAYIWDVNPDENPTVISSVLFKKAMDKQGISNEMHLFKTGEHGLSIATKEVVNKNHSKCNSEVAVWPELVRDWLFKLFGDNWL